MTILSSQESYQRRLDACLACDQLIFLGTTCGVCNCIVRLKAKFAELTCPLHKWTEELNVNAG